MSTIDEWLERMETMLTSLIEPGTIRDWYSSEQFARIIGKSEFTVRGYAGPGRIHAEKRRSDRLRTRRG